MGREQFEAEYASLVRQTIVPASLSLDEQDKIYEGINKCVDKFKPSTLYRFRSLESRYTLSSLDHDEFWFSSANQMNDDFEARLSFDIREFKGWVQSISDGLTVEFVIEQLKNALKSSDLCVFAYAQKCLALLDDLTADKLKVIIKEVVSFIYNDIDSRLDDISNIVQRGTRIACLSESINSDMMWGQYADKATGIALAYNTDDIWKSAMQKVLVYPVIYDDKRIDCTDFLKYMYKVGLLQSAAKLQGQLLPIDILNHFIKSPDLFMATKVAIAKSNDWKAEKEWRAFYCGEYDLTKDNSNPHITLKPKAIYLGRKIDSINKKLVLMIASEKKIPVYQMYIAPGATTYKLEAKKLNSNGAREQFK